MSKEHGGDRTVALKMNKVVLDRGHDAECWIVIKDRNDCLVSSEAKAGCMTELASR